MNDLFQGATLYGASEIINACKVFENVANEYKKAIDDANNYANAESMKLSSREAIAVYFRFLGTGRTFWWRKYDEIYKPLSQKYAAELLYSCGDQLYCNSTEAVRQITILAKANRDCYLNPDQVKMIEMTRKYWS